VTERVKIPAAPEKPEKAITLVPTGQWKWGQGKSAKTEDNADGIRIT